MRCWRSRTYRPPAEFVFWYPPIRRSVPSTASCFARLTTSPKLLSFGAERQNIKYLNLDQLFFEKMCLLILHATHASIFFCWAYQEVIAIIEIYFYQKFNRKLSEWLMDRKQKMKSINKFLLSMFSWTNIKMTHQCDVPLDNFVFERTNERRALHCRAFHNVVI